MNFEQQFTFANPVRRLQAIQKKYEEQQNEIVEQKLKIEVLEAEKLRLEADKKSLEARFDEVDVKLKLKTAQYESLLAKQKNDSPKIDVDQQIETTNRSTPSSRKRKADKQCSPENKKKCTGPSVTGSRYVYINCFKQVRLFNII